ncbi:MAG TPA: MMPL family transporter [Candidatus Limnocylindrales bacterium]|nr:MMPL family transporter [Candidatus Limnocylindrales bacterium]
MFQRLGHVVFRLRFAIVAAWIVAAGACVAFAPNLADVGSADQSTFLPAGVESATARDILDRAFPNEAGEGSATIAFSRSSGLSDADRVAIGAFATWLRSTSPDELRSLVTGVVGAETQPEAASRLRSADGAVELVQVQLSITPFDPKAKDVTQLLRDHLVSGLPAGLTANVTGSVGIGSDYLAAILQATDRTTVVTVVLVILVLLFIYRAPLAAAVPLATIAAAFLVSRGVLGFLGEAGWKISSLLETFVVVLVFGVGTDYTIFLISRFREEVGGTRWAAAVGATVRRIGAVIAASAATVAIGLGSMAAGQFGMFQTTGPALAITILVTVSAGLTLAPALLGIFGHYLFWPLHEASLRRDPERGLFGRLAGLISRRPVAMALVVLVALGAPAIATTRLSQSFDVLADLPPGSDAKAGFEVVADHFDKGQLLPIEVVVDAGPGGALGSPAALGHLRATMDALLAIPGVKRVESLVAPTGDGATPDGFRPSAQLLAMSKRFVVPTDPAAGLKKLLDPATTTGLQSADEYVRALARAYPDLAASPALTTPEQDLAAMPGQIDQLRAAMAGGSPEQLAAARQKLGATGARLPAELAALSSTFGARPDDYFIPVGLSGAGQASIDATRAAYLSADGSVTRLYAITADDPYSPGAFETVGRIREALAEQATAYGPDAIIATGGQTALQRDLQATIDADFLRVAALTVLGVLVVLALLLRSLVAPLYLVGTVLLSYFCTLGIGTVLFQGLLGQSGMNYFLPLMVFVLLVALGSDYNIFLMSRVREESEARGTTDGIRAASARTGAVITSAGVILAGTFLAMVASPLTVLFQVGIMVALGVLIDTFMVRSLLVPAITTILGDGAWWPFGRQGTPPAATPRTVVHPQAGPS